MRVCPFSSNYVTLVHAGAVLELCREQGHRLLPLLVVCPQSAAALKAAWQAVCVLAQDSAEAALEAWLPFLHACR